MPSMRRRPHRWAPWALALVLSSALEITLSEESTLSESSIISEKSPPGDVPTSTSKSSQFSGKWYAGPNASLAFEFRSLHANGLLLYADDAIGHGFFVEAKLVDGRVTLRYRLPTGSSTGSGDRSLTSQQKRGSQQGITSSATIASRITFGRNVSDGLWHRLEMFRSGTEFTHWRLDEELRSDVSTASYIVSSSTPDADEADDSMMSADLFMYFGGLSHPSINTFARKSSNEKPLTARDLRLNSWSVPTAFFERPFIGELRNIILSGPPEGPALTELRPSHVRASAALEPSSTSQNQDDTGFHSNAGGAPAICERNTCGRGSKCIDTPDGPICPDGKNVQDCKDNLHNDRFCNDSYKPEKDSPPSSSAAAAGENVIQLNGAASFLRFNQREPIISSTENISLQFRTTMAAASGTVLNDDPSNSSTGNDEVTLLYLGHESQSVELRLVAGVRFEVTITFPQWKSHSHNGALRQLDAGGGPDANVAGKTAVAHATVLSISSHSIQKGKRFDDGRWHRVVLTRRLDQISLNVDGKEATRTISVGEGPEHFYTSTILVGASGNTSPPEAGISSGPPYFFGCLKEVELVSSGLHLDLIRIAKTNLGFITASGEIEYRCSGSSANNSATAGSKGSPSGTDSANPLGATGAMAKKNHKDQAISFLTPESFIIVLNWTPSGEAYSNSGYNKRKPVLGGWVGGKGRSEISFQFRTTEDSGVLLYSSPATMSHNERAFFFVIELRQGHLELRIGVGGFRRRASVFLPGGGRTSDGQWHKLTLSMDRTGYVIFRADHDAQGNRGPGASNAETNGAIREFRVHGSPGSLYETGGPLFVGGISDLGKNSYPSGLWSEPDLHRGFAGCLRDLSVGGVKLDLRTNLAVAGVQSGCSRAGAPKCPASPCFHGAVCNEGWNRPICDCSRTHFAGPTCETPALSLHFTGSEHITATLPEHQASFGEEIVFRFRTEMSSCTVFASQPGGLLQGSLQDGKFRLAYRFSAASLSQRNGSQVVTVTGYGLDDSTWHYVRILRTASNVAVMVDQESTFAETPSNVRIRMGSLRFGHQLLRFEGGTNGGGADTIATHSFVGEIQHLRVNGVPLSESLRPGEISGFSIESNILPPGLIQASGSLLLSSEHFSTFSAPTGFVALSASPFRGLEITLRIQPTVDSGLVLHWPGANGSGLTLELEDARLKMIVTQPSATYGAAAATLAVSTGRHQRGEMPNNNGSSFESQSDRQDSSKSLRHQHRSTSSFSSSSYQSSAYALRDSGSVSHRSDVVHDRLLLSDNAMHSVRVHSTTGFLRLRVDDQEAGAVETLDASLLQGLVYIGGVREYSILPAPVSSQSGFAGCIGVEDVNGQSIKLAEEAVIPSDVVSQGCRGKASGCSSKPCAHGGVCHEKDSSSPNADKQQTDPAASSGHSFSCDCSFTSFRGATCTQESASYEFHSGGLLLTSSALRRPRAGDALALGLVAEVDNAVLIRVEFLATSDYIQIEIIDGVLFAIYNVAGEDYALNVPGVYVHDRQYHIVRFTHRARASTLQLDQLPVQTRKHKQLQQLADDDHGAADETVGGGISADVKIQLGGVLSGSASAAVSKGFRGVLSGVVLNGVRLLELSAERGDIVVQGDATRLQSLAQSKYSPAHNYPADQPFMLNDAKPPVEVYERDDLVYSEGSGCYESDDDDADCNNNAADDNSNSAGGGDELVTAVYIPSQRRSSAPHYNGNSVGFSAGSGGTTSRPSQKKAIYSCHDDEDCVEEGSGNGIDATRSRSQSSGIIVTPRAPYESPNSGDHSQITTTTARTTTSIYSTTSTTPSPSTTTTTHEWIIVKTFSTRPPFKPRTTSTGIPEVFSVPIPEVHTPTQINKDKSKTKPARVDTAVAADGTALVIGIVAGILVSLVILALLLYRFRTGRPGGACKPNSLYYNPCVGETGATGPGAGPGMGAPIGPGGLGAGGPGGGGGACIPYGVASGGGIAGGAPAYSTLHKGMAVAGNKKSEQVKDPQEWYV